MTKLAVFDVDKTITLFPTWRQFLLLATDKRRHRRMRLAGAMGIAGIAYATGRGTRTGVKEAALRSVLAGRRREELEALAERFVNDLLESGLRPNARRVIEQHKAAGEEVVVATAAVDLIIDPLCEALGIETKLCTPMAWEDGVLQDRFAGPNCYAEEKERQVRDLVEERDGELVAFYSDHISDLGLLKLARRGVAVNPSPALLAAAEANGVDVEDWNQ